MKPVLVFLTFIGASFTASVPDNGHLTLNVIIPNGKSSPDNTVAHNTLKATEGSQDGDIVLILPRNSVDAFNNDAEEDVYWRTWKGKMPADAVIGEYIESDCGSSAPVYLAQVNYKDAVHGITPTQIMKRSKSVKTTYGGKVYETNKNIKILCAENPDIVTWIHVNNTKDLTMNEDCVVAGNEGDSDMFFGKTVHDGDTIISKADRNSMHFPYMGNEQYTKNFEILCYKKTPKEIENMKKKTKLEKEKHKKRSST